MSKPLVIKKGRKATEPFEYFCQRCGQLRLSLAADDQCGNCGSYDIITGKPGELNKDALKEEFRTKANQ